MNAAAPARHTVLCVDDNPFVTEALRVRFDRTAEYEFVGSLPDATELLAKVQLESPEIVLLDLDMPGPDPFEVLTSLADRCPDTRTIILTGHVRKELIERAIEAGAWGYVSKNEPEDRLFEVIDKVLEGQFALSPEVRATLDA